MLLTVHLAGSAPSNPEVLHGSPSGLGNQTRFANFTGEVDSKILGSGKAPAYDMQDISVFLKNVSIFRCVLLEVAFVCIMVACVNMYVRVCVYVTRCNFVYDCSACEYTHVKMFAYEYTVSCICKHVDVYYIDMCETTSE